MKGKAAKRRIAIEVLKKKDRGFCVSCKHVTETQTVKRRRQCVGDCMR